jgi:hypothetical protein
MGRGQRATGTPKGIPVAEAAQRAGMRRTEFNSWASKLRSREKNPIDLRMPREDWIDGRTPLIDEVLLAAVLAARPGRGGRWTKVTR